MWIDSTRLDQFCKPLVPKNWPIQLGMSHIFSITLRWARPGSCAGDHRYQKVLTTVRSAVSREIHAPRRKEVNWRKNSTISYILSWCLGRVDISIVMIYLDILLIILDTVNNNHIIPINTIYIYIYPCVCVFVCVYPSLSLFSGRWNAPSLTQEGTSRLGWAATGLTAIDGGRLAHGKLHDVAHEGCLDSLCGEHLGWPSSTKSNQSEICNYQWLPSSNTSRGQLNPWSIAKGPVGQTALQLARSKPWKEYGTHIGNCPWSPR